MRDRLIPPDPPGDEPLLVLTRGELTRFEYDNGFVSWQKGNRYLTDYEMDLYEDAFQMAVELMQKRLQGLQEKAYGKGVIDAATTAYGGKRHHGNE